MTRMLEYRDPNLIPDVQLAAHSSDFVLAGSETTATALSCITYYMLRTPTAMQKLQKEIRGTFPSYDLINATSTAPMKYLKAVILEGLRIYPPLPFALPRVVPDGGDTVDGHFIPGGVCYFLEVRTQRQTDNTLRRSCLQILSLQVSAPPTSRLHLSLIQIDG